MTPGQIAFVCVLVLALPVCGYCLVKACHHLLMASSDVYRIKSTIRGEEKARHREARLAALEADLRARPNTPRGYRRLRHDGSDPSNPGPLSPEDEEEILSHLRDIRRARSADRPPRPEPPPAPPPRGGSSLRPPRAATTPPPEPTPTRGRSRRVR